MKKLLLILGILFLTIIPELTAQKYAVHFTDKTNSPYSIDNPLEYLSQRALDRRAKFNITITEEDFPVNPSYLTQVHELGAEVLFSSRWLNCALVIADESIISQIEQLSFVEKTVFVHPNSYITKDENSSFGLNKLNEPRLEPTVLSRNTNSMDYGYAEHQIEQLNGIALHDLGFTGEGVLIALLDAGYRNVDQIDAFIPLFESDRIVMVKDFVKPGGNVYASNINQHGTAVLSCMGSYLPGQIIGTAPDASFCLFRTEDGNDEYLIECYNWVIGAEAADSVGADIINTSLGYSTFDDPSMDFTYSQMDGFTTVSSIGATKLIERGVPVVVSAGNSNGSSFPWVGTPADVPEAITLAAVDADGVIAYFSSIGPNGDGFQKPDVAAQGVNSAVVYSDNNIYGGSGTSFSSPILCGMAACLIGAYPEKAPEVIKDMIIRSADKYNNPDIYYGYGIPDFLAAYESVVNISENENVSLCKVFPNPVTTQVNVSSSELIQSIAIVNILGQTIAEQSINSNTTSISCESLTNGVYFVKVSYDNGKIEHKKFIKR